MRIHLSLAKTFLLCAYRACVLHIACEANPLTKMATLNLYIKNPDTVEKARALCARRGLGSISELFERLVSAEDLRKRGVAKAGRRTKKAEVAA